MRRGLISRIENGRICDVVEVGSEFEITEDFFWMDVPDDTTTFHIMTLMLYACSSIHYI